MLLVLHIRSITWQKQGFRSQLYDIAFTRSCLIGYNFKPRLNWWRGISILSRLNLQSPADCICQKRHVFKNFRNHLRFNFLFKNYDFWPYIKPLWPISESKHRFTTMRLSPFDLPWTFTQRRLSNFSPRSNFRISIFWCPHIWPLILEVEMW